MSISRFPCNCPVNPHHITQPLVLGGAAVSKALGAAVLVLQHVWMFQNHRAMQTVGHRPGDKTVTCSHSKDIFTFLSNLLQQHKLQLCLTQTNESPFGCISSTWRIFNARDYLTVGKSRWNYPKPNLCLLCV